MKNKKGWIWTAAIALAVLVLLGWVLWQNARVAERVDNSVESVVMLDGVYALDGGEWRTIDNTQPIDEHFSRAEFRGTLIPSALGSRAMHIVSKNVWYTLRDTNGRVVVMYEPSESDTPDTPGYHLTTIFPDDEGGLPEGDMTLTVEYPYSLKTESFSDCFSVMTSYAEGLYLHFFFDMLPAIVLFLLVCFFGVFFFPIASGLLGRIDYRYIAFGALCFFTGLYMVVHRVSDYANLWIADPAVCLLTDRLGVCLFGFAVILYLRSLLQDKKARVAAAAVASVSLAVIVICVILHAAGKADMMASAWLLYAAMIAAAVAMTAMLLAGIRGKKGFALFDYLISWVPLGVSLFFDMADVFARFPGQFYLQIGLGITILYQTARFAMDFRRQYREAIRHQQVQRELYEAKVSVMVSQIRPHFMYNALSSIAILCKLDPDTAYEATVAFSDYLRGNMDSLRQTAPVPFTQELEHLKKYLYIEKLRFDDQLNIEYDIRDTDFELPLLSIQPLVENAVKHGVGMKDGGGTVRISSRETEDAHEVVVEDDGVGFDVNEVKDDGRSHVGMENTRRRLRDMVGGEIVITSELGTGTTARVIIPKKNKEGAL